MQHKAEKQMTASYHRYGDSHVGPFRDQEERLFNEQHIYIDRPPMNTSDKTWMVTKSYNKSETPEMDPVNIINDLLTTVAIDKNWVWTIH